MHVCFNFFFKFGFLRAFQQRNDEKRQTKKSDFLVDDNSTYLLYLDRYFLFFF